MKFKTKIAATYVIVFISVIGVSIFAIAKVNLSLDSLEFVRDKVSVSLNRMKDVQIDIIKVQKFLTDAALVGSPENYQKAEYYFDEANRLLNDEIKVKKEAGKVELLGPLTAIRSQLDDFYNMGVVMAEKFQEEGPEAGGLWMEKFNPVEEKLTKLVLDQVSLRNRVFLQKISDLVLYQNRIISSLIGVGLIITLVVVIMGIYIFVSFKKGLYLVNNYADRLAAKDLSVTGAINRNDEFGNSAERFRTSFIKLSSLIANIIGSTVTTEEIKDSLSTSAEETSLSILNIKNGTSSLLEESKKMDENVSENVASIEEITANINSIQDQINEQVAMVEEATAAITEMIASLENVDGVTKKKRESVLRLVAAIEGGNNASNETDVKFQIDVIDKIDGISEMANSIQNIAAQTNLLSMNAAIEAAHAGDAGRGFAVVADEIRKLADTASKSSAEITRTIKEISEGIEGTGVVAQKKKDAFVVMNKEIIETRNAFDEIVTSVHELNSGGSQIQDAMVVLQDVSSTIKNAASEMTVGAEHVIRGQLGLKDVSSNISKGMMEINSGTEEIAVAAEELVHYAAELDSVVTNLKEETDKFTI